MAYLYLTKDYKEKHDTADMEYYHEKIRASHYPSSFLEEYGKTNLWKMRVKGHDSHRLILKKIISKRNEENYEVYCPVRLFLRSSSEYIRWYASIENDKENEPMTEAQLKGVDHWLTKKLEEEKEAQKPQPLNDDDLKVYTSTASNIHLSNSNIYESPEWTNSFKEKFEALKEKEDKEDSLLNHEEICSLARNIHEYKSKENVPQEFEVIEVSDQNNKGIFSLAQKDKISILYAKFTPEKSINSSGVTFFFDIYFDTKNRQNAIEIILQKYSYTNNSYEEQKEKLLRDCQRTYNDFILYDSVFWQKIQENEKANLALSIEERKMLDKPSFPLFINGQAGSGKSTVLYYLFAHFYAIPYQNPYPTPNCLFFTYNEVLLKRAKKNIRALLEHNQKYVEKYVEKSIDVSDLHESFYTLQAYVKKYLLPEEAQDLFDNEKYMSFGKFKRCYLGKYPEKKHNCTLPNKSKHSPDLAWHIIRTYIKGYHLDSQLRLEDYQKLNNRERSVSEEEYQDVLENIWQKWYSKFYDKGYFWDDQDLIRYVLQKVQTFPRSPVIFCDEVQDFTRIELDLIWQLSSFTKYDLTGQTNIPFAFAGDPNQTVHPTGFQWNNLIELFTERFKKLNLNDLGLKSKQLFHNYRSKSAIIKFSNLIQKFRFAFLDIAELRPQVSWQKKEGISPSLFILQEDLEIDDLENILQQAMVLIPTSRNEEEYIRKNKFLKEIILPPEKKKKKGKRAKKKRQVLQRTSLNNSTEITENQPKKPSLACKIMSVASAKGLEFDKVVLYNFGDHIPDSFQKSIGGEPLNDNEKIELIHFFSKLYVAVSRASDYLFIIDTQKGFANFWTYFMEQNLISFEQNEYWKESDIVPLSKGEKADLDNITEDNPQKIAETLQESGKTKKNYELLLRAQQYYQSIHQKDQALDCAAWAHWYREDWAKAGKLFTQLQNLPKAAESFWKAKKWQSIKNLPPPIEEKCPYLPYAKYMLKEGDFLQILKKICSNKQLSPNSETWKVIVKQLQKDFKKTIICKDNKTFKDYAFFAEKIGERGFKDFFDIAGDFYFRDKQYSLAIESWDENHNLYEEESFTITRPHYRPSDYFNAQLEITDDDNTDRKVFWLHQLKEYEELVELYEKAEEEEPSKKLNDSTYSFIFNAFVHLKKFDKALAYPHISIQKKAQKFLEKNRLRKLGLQSKESERREQLFNLLLESGFEGGKVLITHIEDFKACFEKKSVGKKISKNKHWKGIFEAYKNLKKGSVFAARLGDFAYYLKDQNWVKNCKNCKNTVLKDQFEYILPFFTDTQYNIKNREEKIELLFKTLVNHTIGINLIHRHIESFDSIFTNEKMLGEVLDKSNWSELLKEFEGNFREGFSSRYPETFIDLVCQQLSKNKTAQLTHTLELMNELTEADKLIQYVKLINSVPKPPTSVSTENLSETLKDHLCKIVT